MSKAEAGWSDGRLWIGGEGGLLCLVDPLA